MTCLCGNSRKDPTNTAGLRRSAFSRIRERLNGAYREVREYIQAIPVEVIEVPENHITNRRIYKYDLIDRDTNKEIHEIVARWFQVGEEMPNRWFMGEFIDQSYRSGTSQEAARLKNLASSGAALSAGELSQLDIENIMMTRPFRSRIDKVYRRAFEEMVGFADEAGNDLARTLADGVGQGKGIKPITSDIKKRFKVAESRAQRIARTEIGHSYRDARADMQIDARDRLGLNTMTQWISALAPTTRPSHAARHLNFYTPEQNAAFYSRDGNSVNCLCAAISVIITKDNKILGERKMTKRDRDAVADLTA